MSGSRTRIDLTFRPTGLGSVDAPGGNAALGGKAGYVVSGKAVEAPRRALDSEDGERPRRAWSAIIPRPPCPRRRRRSRLSRSGLLARGPSRLSAFPPASVAGSGHGSREPRSHIQRRGRAGIEPASQRPGLSSASEHPLTASNVRRRGSRPMMGGPALASMVIPPISGARDRGRRRGLTRVFTRKARGGTLRAGIRLDAVTRTGQGGRGDGLRPECRTTGLARRGRPVRPGANSPTTCSAATSGGSSGARGGGAAPGSASRGCRSRRSTAARGRTLPVTIAAMEGLGYGCPDNGLIFAINASLWTITIPILRYGTEEQKRRYLPGLCDGTLVGANGASEAEAGSDIFSMHDPRRATGRPLGPQRPQDLGDERPGGRPVRLLRDDRPGQGGAGDQRLHRPRATRPASGSSARSPSWACGRCRWASWRFEDCALPADEPARPRGPGGRGLQLLDGVGAGRDPGRHPGHDAPAARTVHRARPDAASSSASRSASSRRSRNRIVDMKLRLETCRPLVYKIGWLKEQGKDATLEAAMAKLHVSECFVQNSLDAVRLFGASGFVDRDGHRARPARQRRQPDLLGDERHPAEHHRPAASPLTGPVVPVSGSGRSDLPPGSKGPARV